MTKKTKNKLTKGGAVFCALLCLMMSVMTLYASASDNIFVEQKTTLLPDGTYRGEYLPHLACLESGNHCDKSGTYPITRDTVVRLVAKISSKLDDKKLNIGQNTSTNYFNTEGVNKTYIGTYHQVYSAFMRDLWKDDIIDGLSYNRWTNEWEGVNHESDIAIYGLDKSDYYYIDIYDEESDEMGSLVGEMFDGMSGTVRGLGNGIKSMFNNILWEDGTAESGLSHFAKFGFILAGLSMACGLGYVIIRKIRG